MVWRGFCSPTASRTRTTSQSQKPTASIGAPWQTSQGCRRAAGSSVSTTASFDQIRADSREIAPCRGDLGQEPCQTPAAAALGDHQNQTGPKAVRAHGVRPQPGRLFHLPFRFPPAGPEQIGFRRLRSGSTLTGRGLFLSAETGEPDIDLASPSCRRGKDISIFYKALPGAYKQHRKSGKLT